MQDNEDLIRRRAHEIWEEQGRPHGQDAAHWHQARREIDDLTDDGATDFSADDRRRDEEDHPEEPPLSTTGHSAAFRLANTKPASQT